MPCLLLKNNLYKTVFFSKGKQKKKLFKCEKTFFLPTQIEINLQLRHF